MKKLFLFSEFISLKSFNWFMDFDSTSEKFLQNKRAVNYLKFK